MATYRHKKLLLGWMAGLIAIVLLSVEIAAACSLAPPSVMMVCEPGGELFQDSVYIDTYDVTDPDEAVTRIQDECADFNVDADTMLAIYKVWNAGVQRDFFQHSMLYIEPYSAEREADIIANPETCRTSKVEQHGDWLIHYGIKLSYCSVNGGDGASCPFLEIDQSALNDYCDFNATEAVCTERQTISSNPRLVIGGIAATATVLIGGALIFLIRRAGDD